MYGIYKLVKDGNIVYIGKSDSSILSRIMNHTKEEKFADYSGSEIFYFEVKNSTETTIYEKLLINKYKPILNVTDVHDESVDIPFEEPEWKPFDIEEETEREKQKKAEIRAKERERRKSEHNAAYERIPRKKRQTFALSITKEDLAKLRKAAFEEDVPIATYIHNMIKTIPEEHLRI